jgi:type VI secretion system protein ImpC
MPRFLSRLPYGAKTNPVEEFNFEEETGGGDHSKYTWTNAAYAMAVNINRSFKLYGWCSRASAASNPAARSKGLPTHTFPTDDGGVDMKCPTEIAISDRREAELAKNGFMPLVHRKNSDFAAFIGAQSLQKPASTTIRTPPPTPTWRRGCRTCSRAAASRTTSSASCATRSARSRNAPTWRSGSTTGS